MKSKRINQLKITLIDNYPELPDNHWYTGWDQERPKYKGRYKLNIWMLTPLRPVQLQSTLAWPPSELARRQRWRDHAEQYEIWRKQTQAIKDDITRPSSIPPLIGMPSELQKFKGKTRGRIHKWYMPATPSLIRVQQLRAQDHEITWNIQWLFPDQTLEFSLDLKDCKTDTWKNDEGGNSLVYIKTYAHAFNLPESHYMPIASDVFIQEELDYEYESFKQRVQHLFDCGAEEEGRTVMVKFPAYTERWLAEVNE